MIRRLWDVGAVEILPAGTVKYRKARGVEPERLVVAQENRRKYDRSRVQMMQGYAETSDCRRVYILDYFGETGHTPCGFCDNCQAGRSVDHTKEERALPPGSIGIHKRWGRGQVLRYEGDRATVLFDEVGYRSTNPAKMEKDREELNGS